jgi:hypothetical protein
MARRSRKRYQKIPGPHISRHCSAEKTKLCLRQILIRKKSRRRQRGAQARILQVNFLRPGKGRKAQGGAGQRKLMRLAVTGSF